MRMKERLINLYQESELTLSMIEMRPINEVIVLRDENKEDIDYSDTDETRRMRDVLRGFNARISDTLVNLMVTKQEMQELRERDKRRRLEGKELVDFSNKQMRRIFNNSSFEHGGRFYGGWWQGISKEYRIFITINGKKTNEVDYSAIHPALLYAQEGLEVPEGDLYLLDGFPDSLRGYYKDLFMMILNADNRDGFINKRKAAWETLLGDGRTIYNVVEALEQKHEALKDYFFTGVGVELQYKDSQIAEEVMTRVWEETNEVVLPMHDSFIVRAGRVYELREIMRKVYREHTDLEVKLDVKKNTFIEEEIEDEMSTQGIIASGEMYNRLKNTPDNEYYDYNIRKEEWNEARRRINIYNAVNSS